MTKNQKLLVTLGCAVVSHLAVGSLGYFLGDRDGWRDGWRDGVRDGHIAARTAVSQQVEAMCANGLYDKNGALSFDGMNCNGAMEVQDKLESESFPNAGKGYRDPIDSVTAYMTPPN